MCTANYCLPVLQKHALWGFLPPLFSSIFVHLQARARNIKFAANIFNNKYVVTVLRLKKKKKKKEVQIYKVVMSRSSPAFFKKFINVHDGRKAHVFPTASALGKVCANSLPNYLHHPFLVHVEIRPSSCLTLWRKCFQKSLGKFNNTLWYLLMVGFIFSLQVKSHLKAAQMFEGGWTLMQLSVNEWNKIQDSCGL